MGGDLRWDSRDYRVDGERAAWLRILEEGKARLANGEIHICDFLDWLTQHCPRPVHDDLVPEHLRKYP